MRSCSTSRTSSFWCGVSRTRDEPCASAVSARRISCSAGDAAHDGGGADEVPAVLLLVDADVVAAVVGRRGRRAVGQRLLEVLGLEHLAELLRAPVGEQELQPGLVAHPAVAVVAEDGDDPGPHVGYVVLGHERAEPHGQPRVGRQPAADPQVVARAQLGVLDADERDVVDLVHDVVGEHPGDRGLELARQVGVGRVADVAALDLLDRRRRVDQLVPGDAGDRRAEDDARAVTAGLGGQQADALEPLPDRGHVLDPHPVQLDVLPVGDVGGAAGVVAGHLADDAGLLGGEGAAVHPDAEHEVLVLELVRLERGGLAAVDARLALGVEPPPAEPPVQVVAADRGEALLAVDVLDAGADVERVVLLLEPLVGVQRLGLAEGPLALAPHLRCAPGTVGPGSVGSGIGHNPKFDMPKGALMNRCHDPDAPRRAAASRAHLVPGVADHPVRADPQVDDVRVPGRGRAAVVGGQVGLDRRPVGVLAR